MIDTSQWIIALLGARTLVGNPSLASDGGLSLPGCALSPVFELAVQTVATPRGPGSTLVARPVLLLGSLKQISLPQGTPVLLVSELCADDRSRIAKIIVMADEDAAYLRTSLTLG